MKPTIQKRITRIPDHLCAPFIQWLINGGHKYRNKKQGMQITKGTKSGYILFDGKVQVDYEITEYLIDRFELFSLQWFKYGVVFINELRSEMVVLHQQLAHQTQLYKLAKVA